MSNYLGEYNVDSYDSECYLGTGRINAHRAVKKIKAMNDAESFWATLEVSMSKDKAINLFWLFLEKLMERFPILEQILQPIYDKLTGI